VEGVSGAVHHFFERYARRGMRVPGLGLALALIVLAACSTGGSKLNIPRDSLGRTVIVLDEGDDNRSVGLSPGGTVAVQLPSEAPGGQTWRLVESLDESVLKLASTGYRPTVGTGGGLGRAVLTFQAVGPGSVTVRLSYGPPDNPQAVIQVFSFVVSVT
jgi:predicted secreted protein